MGELSGVAASGASSWKLLHNPIPFGVVAVTQCTKHLDLTHVQAANRAKAKKISKAATINGQNNILLHPSPHNKS